jgi:hypothetical protein
LKSLKWSFYKLNYLLDASNDTDDIIHQLISVNGLYFKLAFALATFFVVAFLAAQTVIVATWNNRDWLLELMTVRTLNLRQHPVI